MGTANSDNAGTNAALTTFFSVFNPGANAHATIQQKLDILMNNVFCIDDANGNPGVGITQHGPQFMGATKVRALFQQLFTTFPDVWWAKSRTHPAITPVPRLYSNDNYAPPTIGVQTTLWGTHKKPWFQDDTNYSLPLSAIKPNNKATEVPSFAVFSFGARITHECRNWPFIWTAITRCATRRLIMIRKTLTPRFANF